MNERQIIYDNLCNLLTLYENSGEVNMTKLMYMMLVDIQNKWETIITAQDDVAELLEEIEWWQTVGGCVRHMKDNTYCSVAAENERLKGIN